METAEQNTNQFMEENDVLKQFMELLNQQYITVYNQMPQERGVVFHIGGFEFLIQYVKFIIAQT